MVSGYDTFKEEIMEKKSERLNQELIWFSYQKIFHLKDLMEEFHISKSTALRDLQSLEGLGLSFYTESGRYGSYHILRQELLAPVYFSEDEISAILFGLQAQENLTLTPFAHSYHRIYPTARVPRLTSGSGRRG
jgi:predicted DNA-binding transcriptional regulator YafY